MNKQKQQYNNRDLLYMGILCLLAVLTLYSLTASAGSGDASITINGGETVASITTVTNSANGVIDFGSFRLGSQASTISQRLHLGNADNSTTGDVQVVQEAGRLPMFNAVVAANSNVTINIGDGVLTVSDTDRNSAINASRSTATMNFTTRYLAYVKTSSCIIPGCLPNANKVTGATGENTIQSGSGTTLEFVVAGTLIIPANASTNLKYGSYSGTYPMTVTYE